MVKITVGPVGKGLRNDIIAAYIDNDSFPRLVNAFQWRGRVKRKRGTSPLNRLSRYFDSTSTTYNFTSPFNTDILFNGSGVSNILTPFSLQSNATVVPSSVTIRITTAPNNTYTDNGSGILLLAGTPSGTINYASGSITIVAEAGLQATVTFTYYPALPVLGLEDLLLRASDDPGNITFDTTYSYNIQTTYPYNIYAVNFYKNPPTGTTGYTNYVQKSARTPTTWNGQNYQQFWTTNYEGAIWATNGVSVPFSVTNVGMQYNTITAMAIVAGPPGVATITTNTNHGLVIGDFVFINEVVGVTGINWQTGYVTNVPAVNQIEVTFPNATLGGAYSSGGIVQYLTNRSDVTKDCIRWYDGDPTSGVSPFSASTTGNGWVNFCPPLSQSNFSIANLKPAIYYLVGARMIVPFKDRLLFIGPIIQTSSAGSQVYLQDTVIYSQNGTPYYTCSYTNSPTAGTDTPTSPTNVFNPILVPATQTANSNPFVATPYSFFSDSTGFGGFIPAGTTQFITTVSTNEDALVIGFSNNLQTRLVYSGNDIIPFNFFIVNSEYGSASTFSAINTDDGVITKGNRGYIITSQTSCNRIDPQIPNEVFQVSLINNGNERFTAQRDFFNEWIYFTYPSNQNSYVFPTRTLFYNYRDNTYAIFNEAYTTYGQFTRKTGLTWATIGTVYKIWKEWNDPWNSGGSTLLQPEVIAGNQQGFVVFRSDGTGEADSLFIQSISNSTITSPNHCLEDGDYIVISGCLGDVGASVNGEIFSVKDATTNTFVLNPTIPSGLSYEGNGTIKKMYVPFIQTKQFPVAWDAARKTRIGPQQYLLTRTPSGQVTLLIYLSQNDELPFNNGPIVPEPGSVNNSLIYSTLLFTCPESTNLGLTPANTNLQMLTELSSAGVSSNAQQQIWHRMNTSLIGDTVQVAITLSDAQMRDEDFNSQFEEIELHGFILDVSPSSLLA